MDADIKQLLGEVIEHVDKKFEENQRHFSVIDEALQHQIRQVAEGVSVVDRKVNVIQKDLTTLTNKVEEIDVRLISVEDKVDNLEKDIKIVKTDVGFIKSELPQKVSRQEFTFLETRVANLENKT